MKHLNYILIILVIFIFITCKKEEIAPPPPYHGEVYVELNGIPLEYNVNPFESQWNKERYSYITGMSNKHGYSRQRLTITNVPLEVGTYPLSKTIYDHIEGDTTTYANFSFWGSDGDVLYNSYHIPENDTFSTITIKEYIPETDEIFGTFQVLFERDTSAGYQGAIDSITVTNGMFHIYHQGR